MSEPTKLNLPAEWPIDDEGAARRKFKKQKADLQHAILHDQHLTKAERLIGREIADHLNFKTGDAWPSREYLAAQTDFSVKTVERATRVLAGGTMDNGRWFRREIDGRGYRYIPRFDQLDGRRSATAKAVDNRRHSRPEIGDILGGENVALSSLENPYMKENLDGACGKVRSLPPHALKKMVGRSKSVVAFSNQDEIDRIQTAAARANGERAFVYVDFRTVDPLGSTMNTKGGSRRKRACTRSMASGASVLIGDRFIRPAVKNREVRDG